MAAQLRGRGFVPVKPAAFGAPICRVARIFRAGELRPATGVIFPFVATGSAFTAVYFQAAPIGFTAVSTALSMSRRRSAAHPWRTSSKSLTPSSPRYRRSCSAPSTLVIHRRCNARIVQRGDQLCGRNAPRRPHHFRAAAIHRAYAAPMIVKAIAAFLPASLPHSLRHVLSPCVLRAALARMRWGWEQAMPNRPALWPASL